MQALANFGPKVISTWKDHLMVMESTDRDDAVRYAQGKYYFVTVV